MTSQLQTGTVLSDKVKLTVSKEIVEQLRAEIESLDEYGAPAVRAWAMFTIGLELGSLGNGRYADIISASFNDEQRETQRASADIVALLVDLAAFKQVNL